jgi:hypothetical protein
MKLFGIVVVLALLAGFASAGGEYSVVDATYTALAAGSYRVASAPGDVACAPSGTGDWKYQGAKLIKVSAEEAAFGAGNGGILPSGYSLDTFYIDPVGRTSNGTNLNGAYDQASAPSTWNPIVFWKLPGRDCYNWNYAPAHKYVSIPSIGNSNREGTLNFWYQNAENNGIFVNEQIGPTQERLPGSANYSVVQVKFIAENTAYPTLRFKSSDANLSTITYSTATDPYYNYIKYELPFTTERGSVWKSVETAKVAFSLAKEIAKPSFAFSAPTSPAAHVFSTLITDTIDRTLQNRKSNGSEDMYSTNLGTPDTGGAITSPLRAVATPPVSTSLYMIGAVQFPAFVDRAIVDSQAGLQYVEKQGFFIGSTPNAVRYDTDSSIKDVDVNTYSAAAYSAKFEGNDYGIPVCTGDLNSSTPDDWTSCPENSNTRTDSHRVKIKFMGSDWIISQMTAPTSQLASSTAAINGGQVKLAKENAYGILPIGYSLYSYPFEVRLSDISAAAGPGNTHPAIFDILRNGGLVSQIQVSPRTTYTFTQAGTNDSVKIHVYQTAFGSTNMTKWAETSLYAEEAILKDGQRYNLVSPASPDKNFKVSLLWKNRDYFGAGASSQPDSLREVVIYDLDTFIGNKYKKLDTYNFMKSSPAFTLLYEGITPVHEAQINTTVCDSSYTNLSIGQVIGSGALRARLSDISASPGHPAIVDVLDANGVLLGQVQVDSGVPYTFVVSGTGDTMIVDVCQTGFGFTLGTKWAMMKVGYPVQPSTDSYYESLAAANYNLANQPGDVSCSFETSRGMSSHTAKAIMVRMGGQLSLRLNGNGGYTLNALYYDPIGKAKKDYAQEETAESAAASLPVSASPIIMWKLPGRDCYNWNYVAYNNNIAYIDQTGAGTLGALGFFGANMAVGNQTIFPGSNGIIGILESSANGGTVLVPIYFGAGSAPHQFATTYPGTLAYVTGNGVAIVGVPPSFVSQGGTTVNSIKQRSVAFSMSQVTNSPPVIQSAAIPAVINVNKPATFTWTATDPDNNIGSWQVSWGDGRGQGIACLPGAGCNTFSVEHTYSAIGMYTIKVKVVDAFGAEDNKLYGVAVTSANRAPVITRVKGPSVLNASQQGTWTISAYDPENGSLSFSVVWGDEPVEKKEGSAKAINASFTHIYYDAGTYTVQFTVEDEQGASAEASISVLVKSDNHNPVLTGGMSWVGQIIANQQTIFNWQATDEDGDDLDWSVMWGDGSISPVSVCPQGAGCYLHSEGHAYPSAGVYNLTVSVNDRRGGTASESYFVAVAPGKKGLEISPAYAEPEYGTIGRDDRTAPGASEPGTADNDGKGD